MLERPILATVQKFCAYAYGKDYAALGKVLRKDGSWTDWTGSFYKDVALKGFKRWNDLPLQETLSASKGPGINGIHDLSHYAPSSGHSAQFVRHSTFSSPAHYPSHPSYWRRAPTEGPMSTPLTSEASDPASASGSSPAQDGFPLLPAQDSPSEQQLQSASLSNRQRCFLPTKSRPSTPNPSGGCVLTVDGKLQPSAGPSLLGHASFEPDWQLASSGGVMSYAPDCGAFTPTSTIGPFPGSPRNNTGFHPGHVTHSGHSTAPKTPLTEAREQKFNHDVADIVKWDLEGVFRGPVPSLEDDGTVSWLTSWPVANKDADSDDLCDQPNPETLKTLNMDLQMGGDPSSSLCCDEVTLGNLNVISGINDIWSDLGFDGIEWL
jgi:hypothetical protein